jgi:hypothetical protein
MLDWSSDIWLLSHIANHRANRNRPATDTMPPRRVATKILVHSGPTKTVAGQSALELVPASGPRSVTWIEPKTDYVLTYQPFPAVPTQRFTWLPATSANLEKLTMVVPRGFEEAASFCADGEYPIPPGTDDPEACHL